MDEAALRNGEAADGVAVKLLPITPNLIVEEQRNRPPVIVPQELLDYEPGSYRIGPADVLYVTVWDHPELTTPSGNQQQIESNGRLVRPNGEFFFPYIGNIKAGGMTIEELAAFMTRELAKYIENPQLDVAVIRYGSQKVYLSGGFKNTNPIALNSKPLTLVEALGIGGVDDQRSDLSAVKLIRDGREYTLDVYTLNRDSDYLNRIYLKNGDAIHLTYNDNKKVFVMGEVAKPQSLMFRADRISLSDALASVGGLDQATANGKGIYVIRGMEEMGKDPARIFQLDGSSATGFILANRFQLEPQDIIYVGPTDISRWNRVVAELMPTLELLNITADDAILVKRVHTTYGGDSSTVDSEVNNTFNINVPSLP